MLIRCNFLDFCQSTSLPGVFCHVFVRTLCLFKGCILFLKFMKREYKLDFLRALAIISVLIIHAVLFYEPSEKIGIEMLVGGWLTMTVRPCIAIFLFLSGYLFKTDFKDVSYLIKKYKRVILPYLFFSLITLIIRGKTQIIDYITSRPVDILIDILIGNTWGIYYFVFVIVFIYALAFFILKTPQFRVHLISITLLLFVLNLLQGAYYNSLINILNIANTEFARFYSERFLLSWPFFFFLGIIFKKYNGQLLIDNHKSLVTYCWIYIFTIYSFLYFIGVDNIDVFNSVIGTFYSLATIAFLLQFNIRNEFLNFLSKISYSIYLSHILFIDQFKNISHSLEIEWPFLSWLIIGFSVSLIGSIIVYLIAKILLKEKSGIIIGA